MCFRNQHFFCLLSTTVDNRDTNDIIKFATLKNCGLHKNAFRISGKILCLRQESNLHPLAPQAMTPPTEPRTQENNLVTKIGVFPYILACS